MSKYRLIKPLYSEFFNPVPIDTVIEEIKDHNWDLDSDKKLYGWNDGYGNLSKKALTEKKLNEISIEIKEA